MRSYEEINEKIKAGTAVVVTAEEVVDIVKEIGITNATKKIDVVTTATFGPMCSSGAFLNFGHTSPAIRMEKVTLNDVPASGGLAAVDTYIGATEESNEKGYEYGGAHVICDLIAGKPVELKATGKGTDCYPRKSVKRSITLEDLNEAYIYNPRNCYQNYAAAANTSNRPLYTYMGTLLPNVSVVTYSTAGTLSPLLNDPYYRTIGIGTRIFIAGAQGYVAWRGTQFNSAAERDENGIPKGTGGTLALVGDMKEMSKEFIAPAVYEKYGTSLFVGVGIPIPILDEEMMKQVSIGNDKLETNVLDYSVSDKAKPILKRVTYEALQSGKIEIDGKEVKTAPLASLYKARQIAELLKEQIEKGEFYLSKPVELFNTKSTTKPMGGK
ncbi:MAG: homocysteine biosynthesis protein [Clostridiales bacterium]|nr:homocysteine biosynthesis protein [Clostridiales bacterium]